MVQFGSTGKSMLMLMEPINSPRGLKRKFIELVEFPRSRAYAEVTEVIKTSATSKRFTISPVDQCVERSLLERRRAFARSVFGTAPARRRTYPSHSDGTIHAQSMIDGYDEPLEKSNRESRARAKRGA